MSSDYLSSSISNAGSLAAGAEWQLPLPAVCCWQHRPLAVGFQHFDRQALPLVSISSCGPAAVTPLQQMTARPPGGARRPLQRPLSVLRLGRAHTRPRRLLWLEPSAVLLLLVAGPPLQRAAAADAAPPEADTGEYSHGGDGAGGWGWPPGPGPSHESVARQMLLQANDLPQNRSDYAQGSSAGIPLTGTSSNNPKAFPVPSDYE